MTPSTNQQATDSTDYDTEPERMVREKRPEILLSIAFVDEQTAREWLGAANGADVPQSVVEHYADEVRRLK